MSALRLLVEMLSQSIAANVITYNAAFSACGLVSAPRLLEEMLSQGIAPNAITYNAGLSTCGRKSAPRLLEEMLSQGIAPNDILRICEMFVVVSSRDYSLRGGSEECAASGMSRLLGLCS